MSNDKSRDALSNAPNKPMVKKSFSEVFKIGLSDSPRETRSAVSEAIDEGIPVAEIVNSKQ